ncbi:uncharacterized protein LOC114477123 [Gouania willdenowi]|uniref:uncharacterized protein LOC114477123 n=1 Tax=Gouania willdenowi TaxID=441366 RepID=UPI001054D4AB|nr:uncharacterized protein LOC114477123 [Gouania willdenowi]
MPSFSHPASLICVLLCMSVALQRSNLRFQYVTHNSFFSCSCNQEPPLDCDCKEIPSSPLHRSQSGTPPVFSMRHLTVWFTSPVNTAHLLNNSEVHHLTLNNCEPRGAPAFPLEGHFAVQQLARLTVIHHVNTDSHPDPEADNAAHMDTNCYERDTIVDPNPDTNKRSQSGPSAQIQDMFLGRELGADYHEQARLGIIHSSVLEWGSVVKAYTVQTHINSDGVLPFAKLHLPKLQETSVIYVSFVY